MRFLTAQLSDPGGRENNEDAWAVRTLAPDLQCWVIADGLGGHGGGEIAAHLCVEEVVRAAKAGGGALSEAAVRGAVAAAQRAVLESQQASDDRAGMRSTLVMLLASAGTALWAHVGDSRLYHLRDGRIVAQTQDHSVTQLLVLAGDLPADGVRGHPDRNRLIRCVGQPGEVDPAVDGPRAIRAGDAFLLCTDGFWESVYETEMEVDFAKAGDPHAWLALMGERLRRRLRPDSDNYSAIGVFVTEDAHES